MAGKKKKKAQGKPPASADAPREEVERLIRKENYKDAVKQAKIAFRDAATDENHRLLERAYLLRARQLRQNGMPASAIEVAGHLNEFGVTDPALVEDAARLFLALGMPQEADAILGRIESPEVRAKLALVTADQAVLHSERAKSAPLEIRQGAGLIRTALEAVQAGDETRAMESLREVSRSSPFADWKLFARGLAAFYRRDLPEATANWDRLDPDRAAVRIARALSGPASTSAVNGDTRPQKAPNFTAMERQVFGEPVLEPLARVRDLVAKGYWPEAVRELGPIRHALRRLDPALAQRLTRILVPLLIRSAEDLEYHDAKRLIDNFTRLAEPLAIDPNWNRLYALAWEEFEEADEPLRFWDRYLADLKTLAALPADERTLAQALVWKHLAWLHVQMADSAEEDEEGWSMEHHHQHAIKCLEESIRLAPRHVAAYEHLIDAHDRWDEPEKAAAAARRLLKVFPDHVETLSFLAEHHLELDQPEQALPYAQRASALKPLDKDLAEAEWAAHIGLARHLALQGRFDDGRAEFDAAEGIRVEKNSRYHLLARRVVFELKAGRPDVAEKYITEARALLPEPGPLWLAIEIEAARYELPKADRDRFAKLWKTALKARRRGESAGKIAYLIGAYTNSDVKYPGRDQHVEDVVGYLRRSTQLKFSSSDLLYVCALLAQLPDEADLLSKFVKKGLKLFPENPHFHLVAAGLEIRKGPFRGSLTKARSHYEKALQFAQASDNPDDAALVPRVKEGIAMIEGMSNPQGMPFAGFGFGGREGPTLDDLYGMFGDFDVDPDDDEFSFEDDFDEADEPAPAPPKARGGKPKRRRR